MLLALHMRTVQNRLAGKATLDFCEGMSGASMITLHLLKRGFNGWRFDTKLDPRHDVCTEQGLRVWLFERSHLRKGGTRASLFNTVGRGTLDIKFAWRRWPGIGSVRVRLARAHRRGPRCLLEGGGCANEDAHGVGHKWRRYRRVGGGRGRGFVWSCVVGRRVAMFSCGVVVGVFPIADCEKVLSRRCLVMLLGVVWQCVVGK
jgi:hypothetical protein